ncbi:hypothetical protein [Acetivibrio mesophilus]|uniref:Uncharacterized protein n=1 Tax=Acetivibrio mesophilus TaxID=2487273 RepID=A0A4Q0I6S8_9FIRM|nr:hypothetical protein [Acetivibrio mesophilus]ODM25478.1 hypothetical protein A7W90_04115 [Clostridium sp. Bc-iso-3]RXE60093.1 hypothetical protein EFD62_02330 [Acetivibrio mesophilus]HHV30768.1 hypothetical protein [Clostridium sp.]
MHTIPIALPTGLPNGSNITKNGGNIKWIPSSNDINNVYTITIKLFNTDSYNNPVNKYEETFTVKVTDGSTQQMTTGKSGLIIDKEGNEFDRLPIIEELFRERSNRDN